MHRGPTGDGRPPYAILIYRASGKCPTPPRATPRPASWRWHRWAPPRPAPPPRLGTERARHGDPGRTLVDMAGTQGITGTADGGQPGAQFLRVGGRARGVCAQRAAEGPLLLVRRRERQQHLPGRRRVQRRPPGDAGEADDRVAAGQPFQEQHFVALQHPELGVEADHGVQILHERHRAAAASAKPGPPAPTTARRSAPCGRRRGAASRSRRAGRPSAKPWRRAGRPGGPVRRRAQRGHVRAEHLEHADHPAQHRFAVRSLHHRPILPRRARGQRMST